MIRIGAVKIQWHLIGNNKTHREINKKYLGNYWGMRVFSLALIFTISLTRFYKNQMKWIIIFRHKFLLLLFAAFLNQNVSLMITKTIHCQSKWKTAVHIHIHTQIDVEYPKTKCRLIVNFPQSAASKFKIKNWKINPT
jgi:hypothetical protein